MEIKCPHCGANYEVTEEELGTTADCMECGRTFVVGQNNAKKQIRIKSSASKYQPLATSLVKGTNGENSDQGKGKKEKEDYEARLMASLPDEIRHRIPFVTFVLMTASFIMAIIVMHSAGTVEPDAEVCAEYGANFRPLTFGGQWWRLFASAFIHFDIKHLIMNMLCLFSVGRFLEKLIGHVGVFCIYFLASITGGVLSMLCHDNTVVCAGASGAVFGLFGCGVMYVLLVWRVYNLEVTDVFGYMKSGLVFIGINFLYSLRPGVDMAAHIGGLIGGLGLGVLMALPILKKEVLHIDWCRRGVTFSTVLLAVVMFVTVFTGRDATCLDTETLSSEVAKSIRDKLKESIESEYGKTVSVEVKVHLFHDNGDKYHGLMEADCKYDENHETLTKKIDVTYDGKNFMWTLEN